MRWFWQKKKVAAIRDPRINHDFNDEDRELAFQVREMKLENAREKAKLDLEIQRLRTEREKLAIQRDMQSIQSEISDFASESNEQPEENDGGFMDKMLMLLLTKVMSGNNPSPSIPMNTGVSPSTAAELVPHDKAAAVSLSDEQLEELWHKIPGRFRKIAKGLSDEQLKNYIIGQVPNIDADSINRAIKMVRE